VCPQATDRRSSRGTRDVPTNENLQTRFSVGLCALKPLIDEAAEELVMWPQMKISKPVFQYVPSSHWITEAGHFEMHVTRNSRALEPSSFLLLTISLRVQIFPWPNNYTVDDMVSTASRNISPRTLLL
jgi:hypothetical protein